MHFPTKPIYLGAAPVASTDPPGTLRWLGVLDPVVRAGGGCEADKDCKPNEVCIGFKCVACPPGQIRDPKGNCVGGASDTGTSPWVVLGLVAIVVGGVYVASRGAGAGLAENPSRTSHQREYFFVAGYVPHSYSKPFRTRIEAEHHRDDMSGPWQSEGTILSVRGTSLADVRSRLAGLHHFWLEGR